jgi:hypothetical protein
MPSCQLPECDAALLGIGNGGRSRFSFRNLFSANRLFVGDVVEVKDQAQMSLVPSAKLCPRISLSGPIARDFTARFAEARYRSTKIKTEFRTCNCLA